MLIVREIFTAKPGQAGKLAKMFKKMPMPGQRVLTDFVGNYNTVVTEMEVESLAEWEKAMMEYRSGKYLSDMDPALAEEMSHYTEMYLTGRREIFQVVE